MNLWDNGDGKTCLDLDWKRKQNLSLTERFLYTQYCKTGIYTQTQDPSQNVTKLKKSMIFMKRSLPAPFSF